MPFDDADQAQKHKDSTGHEFKRVKNETGAIT